MRKISFLLLVVMCSCSLFAAISNPAGSIQNQTMKYISLDSFYSMLSNHEDYLLLDLRKVEDYQEGHILGAVSADMDKAMNGDYDDGIRVMKTVLKEKTGSENGKGKTIILACYTGNRYAQAATNVLGAIHADLNQVYTLKGGNIAWNESTYKCLVTKEIGEPNQTILDEFALGLLNGGQEEKIDEANRLATTRTLDKDILSQFDFSSLHGSPNMNIEVILDIFTIHTPCAMESWAAEEGFLSGYEGSDIFLEHMMTRERALRHRDGSTTINYKNGSVGTVLLSLSKDRNDSRIKPFDEKSMKVAYVAFDEEMTVIAFHKVNLDYAKAYGETLGGTVHDLEKGILVENQVESFSFITTPELTALVLY